MRVAPQKMGEVEQPSLPGDAGPRGGCLPAPALGWGWGGRRVIGEPGGRARGETLDLREGLMEGSPGATESMTEGTSPPRSEKQSTEECSLMASHGAWS